MTTDRPISEAVQSYGALFEADGESWGAACWTVIKSKYSDDQLLSRLSNDYELLPPVTLEQLQELAYAPEADRSTEERGAMGWLVKSGDAVGLLEINGFAGSMTETLSALTGGTSARAIAMYWNDAIARASLHYAVGGAVQTVDLVSEDHGTATDPKLVEALAQLDNEAAFEANGMAVVERLSGVRLDHRLLSQQWPIVRFRMRQRPVPAVPDTAMVGDPAFAFALIQAPAALRRAAQIEMVHEVLKVTGLADEPAAAACAAQLSAGEVPERTHALFELLRELEERYEIPTRANIDLSHPDWLRRQAGNMLFALCNSRDDRDLDPRRFQSWLSAKVALGDQWPTARARYLTKLLQPD
jgi:hypothetical protein